MDALVLDCILDGEFQKKRIDLPFDEVIGYPPPKGFHGKQLVAHADRHLTMKQAANGNLIIGGAWTADDDPGTGRGRILRDSIEGNLWVAERTVPAISGLHLIRSWAAMNVNIDGAPLLGALPGCPGVFIAATANGYTLGPLMGKLTAELVVQGHTERDITPFGMARFA